MKSSGRAAFLIVLILPMLLLTSNAFGVSEARMKKQSRICTKAMRKLEEYLGAPIECTKKDHMSMTWNCNFEKNDESFKFSLYLTCYDLPFKRGHHPHRITLNKFKNKPEKWDLTLKNGHVGGATPMTTSLNSPVRVHYGISPYRRKGKILGRTCDASVDLYTGKQYENYYFFTIKRFYKTNSELKPSVNFLGHQIVKDVENILWSMGHGIDLGQGFRPEKRKSQIKTPAQVKKPSDTSESYSKKWIKCSFSELSILSYISGVQNCTNPVLHGIGEHIGILSRQDLSLLAKSMKKKSISLLPDKKEPLTALAGIIIPGKGEECRILKQRFDLLLNPDRAVLFQQNKSGYAVRYWMCIKDKNAIVLSFSKDGEPIFSPVEGKKKAFANLKGLLDKEYFLKKGTAQGSHEYRIMAENVFLLRLLYNIRMQVNDPILENSTLSDLLEESIDPEYHEWLSMFPAASRDSAVELTLNRNQILSCLMLLKRRHLVKSLHMAGKVYWSLTISGEKLCGLLFSSDQSLAVSRIFIRSRNKPTARDGFLTDKQGIPEKSSLIIFKKNKGSLKCLFLPSGDMIVKVASGGLSDEVIDLAF